MAPTKNEMADDKTPRTPKDKDAKLPIKCVSSPYAEALIVQTQTSPRKDKRGKKTPGLPSSVLAAYSGKPERPATAKGEARPRTATAIIRSKFSAYTALPSQQWIESNIAKPLAEASARHKTSTDSPTSARTGTARALENSPYEKTRHDGIPRTATSQRPTTARKGAITQASQSTSRSSAQTNSQNTTSAEAYDTVPPNHQTIGKGSEGIPKNMSGSKSAALIRKPAGNANALKPITLPNQGRPSSSAVKGAHVVYPLRRPKTVTENRVINSSQNSRSTNKHLGNNTNSKSIEKNTKSSVTQPLQTTNGIKTSPVGKAEDQKKNQAQGIVGNDTKTKLGNCASIYDKRSTSAQVTRNKFGQPTPVPKKSYQAGEHSPGEKHSASNSEKTKQASLSTTKLGTFNEDKVRCDDKINENPSHSTKCPTDSDQVLVNEQKPGTTDTSPNQLREDPSRSITEMDARNEIEELPCSDTTIPSASSGYETFDGNAEQNEDQQDVIQEPDIVEQKTVGNSSKTQLQATETTHESNEDITPPQYSDKDDTNDAKVKGCVTKDTEEPNGNEKQQSISDKYTDDICSDKQECKSFAPLNLKIDIISNDGNQEASSNHESTDSAESKHISENDKHISKDISPNIEDIVNRKETQEIPNNSFYSEDLDAYNNNVGYEHNDLQIRDNETRTGANHKFDKNKTQGLQSKENVFSMQKHILPVKPQIEDSQHKTRMKSEYALSPNANRKLDGSRQGSSAIKNSAKERTGRAMDASPTRKVNASAHERRKNQAQTIHDREPKVSENSPKQLPPLKKTAARAGTSSGKPGGIPSSSKSRNRSVSMPAIHGKDAKINSKPPIPSKDKTKQQTKKKDKRQRPKTPINGVAMNRPKTPSDVSLDEPRSASALAKAYRLKPPPSPGIREKSLAIIGGTTADDDVSYICWVQTPSGAGWEELAQLPEMLDEMTVCNVSDGFIVVGGHISGKPSGECYHFSISTMKWHSLPEMPTPRHCSSTVLLEDSYGTYEMFVLGGGVGFGSRMKATHVCESLDLRTLKWKRHFSMKQGMMWPISVAINGCIFVLFNDQDVEEGDCITRSLQMYDTTTIKWEYRAPLPDDIGATCGAQAIAINDSMLVAGGYSRICANYLPTTNTWVKMSEPNLHHQYGSMVVCDCRVFILGGDCNDGENEEQRVSPAVEEFDFENNQWILSDIKLPMGLYLHHAVSLEGM